MIYTMHAFPFKCMFGDQLEKTGSSALFYISGFWTHCQIKNHLLQYYFPSHIFFNYLRQKDIIIVTINIQWNLCIAISRGSSRWESGGDPWILNNLDLHLLTYLGNWSALEYIVWLWSLLLSSNLLLYVPTHKTCKDMIICYVHEFYSF